VFFVTLQLVVSKTTNGYDCTSEWCDYSVRTLYDSTICEIAPTSTSYGWNTCPTNAQGGGWLTCFDWCGYSYEVTGCDGSCTQKSGCGATSNCCGEFSGSCKSKYQCTDQYYAVGDHCKGSAPVVGVSNTAYCEATACATIQPTTGSTAKATRTSVSSSPAACAATSCVSKCSACYTMSISGNTFTLKPGIVTGCTCSTGSVTIPGSGVVNNAIVTFQDGNTAKISNTGGCVWTVETTTQGATCTSSYAVIGTQGCPSGTYSCPSSTFTPPVQGGGVQQTDKAVVKSLNGFTCITPCDNTIRNLYDGTICDVTPTSTTSSGGNSCPSKSIGGGLLSCYDWCGYTYSGTTDCDGPCTPRSAGCGPNTGECKRKFQCVDKRGVKGDHCPGSGPTTSTTLACQVAICPATIKCDSESACGMACCGEDNPDCYNMGALTFSTVDGVRSCRLKGVDCSRCEKEVPLVVPPRPASASFFEPVTGLVTAGLIISLGLSVRD
jgi:hypothetical protein